MMKKPPTVHGKSRKWMKRRQQQGIYNEMMHLKYSSF